MTNYLENEKISVLMRKFSIPCIISLLVGALYNIVDQLFISNASYLGSYGNAANTAVYPLTVIALAVCVMIGDGACTFVSISQGKGEQEKADQAVGNAIILLIISSLVITIVYLIGNEGIVSFFGGSVNEETFTLAKEYFFYITLGIPFYMFGQGINPVIRSDGSPKFAMIATLSGAIANIILDPIMIFLFRWGMRGAAIATVIGQIITAILSILYLCKPKAIQLTKKAYQLNIRIIGTMIPMGITSFLSQFSLVLSMAAVNKMIVKYSALDAVFSVAEYAQIPMAVVGIVMKFFQIVISIVVGMAAGCIPVVGFNIGAGRKDRVKELLTKLLTYEAITGAIAFVIVELFPQALINLFGASNESIYYTQFALKAFRIYLCMIVLACINKAAFIFLQAMGKAFESTMLSMVREVVFGVGLALLLPLFFDLNGVLYSMPLSDFLTFIIAFIVLKKAYKELKA